MTIQSLSSVSLAELTGAFNEAFSDYFVKLQLTEPAMAVKLRSENIDLNYSIGAFENNQLIGFILHGIDTLNGVKTVYNAGTGVVSAHRGKGLTEQLYKAVLPLLRGEGMIHHQLEVIEQNAPAIRVYEKIGFQTARTFSCFKGTVNGPIDPELTISEATIPDVEAYASWWNFAPSWQNDTPAIQRAPEEHKVVELRKGEQLLAYAAYMPATGRVKQYGVHPAHRRKGYGRQLFSYLCSTTGQGEVNLINIDESDTASIGFFKAIGFQRFLGLWEMKYTDSN
jgi:ribosomal protein S18 acetylase RimI-like enzyme